jgi:hypothetical protein
MILALLAVVHLVAQCYLAQQLDLLAGYRQQLALFLRNLAE